MNPLNLNETIYECLIANNRKQTAKCEQTPVQPIEPSPVDMVKKEPFHFLHVLQMQLIREKSPQTNLLKSNDDIYPKENRDFWLAFENAVSIGDCEKAESLRKQLLGASGDLIKPKITAINEPITDCEKVQNIFINLTNKHSPNNISDILLCHGVDKNNLPLVYLALKCGAKSENLQKDYEGYEFHILKKALERSPPCDIALIRLLFEFTKEPKNLANGTLLTKPQFSNPVSPLKIAFEVGRADIIRELLINGAILEMAWNKQVREENLFLNAADKGYSEIVQLFLRSGFPVNFQNDAGRTALHFAKLRKNEDLVKDLLAAGANPELKENHGWNYLQFAEEGWKNYDKAAREKLISALQKGDYNIAFDIEKILSNLLDLNESMDHQDNTLLHLAIKHLHLYRNKYGVKEATALILKLINLGADLHRKNKENATPFETLQKAILAQEHFLDKIGKNELLENGRSLFEQVIIDEEKDALIRQVNNPIIWTRPLVPLYLEKINQEKQFLEALKSLDQFIIDNKK